MISKKYWKKWFNKSASGFLEFDMIEASLLCLLEMGDRRETIYAYRGKLGLLVTL